jgi:hypothetical protein
MEEYYMWRANEHHWGSPAYHEEDRRRQYYREQRLAHRDPKVLKEEAELLMGDAAFEQISVAGKLATLRQARRYIALMPRSPMTIDLKDPKRRQMDAMEYLDREIARLQAPENRIDRLS